MINIKLKEEQLHIKPTNILKAIYYNASNDYNLDNYSDIIKKCSYLIHKINNVYLKDCLKFFSIKNQTNIARNLVNLNLYKEIFGVDYNGDYAFFDKVNNYLDFVFLLVKDNNENDMLNILKNKFKFDSEELSYIKALFFTNKIIGENQNDRMVCYKMYQTNPKSFNSSILTDYLKDVIKTMCSYPLSVNQIEIQRNEIKELGFDNLREIYTKILKQIYADKLKNKHEDISKFVIDLKHKTIDKCYSHKGKINTIIFYDFDNTLFNVVDYKEAKEIFKQHGDKLNCSQKDYWTSNVSISNKYFELLPNNNIVKVYEENKDKKNVLNVLLTNRDICLSSDVIHLLDKYNIKFDDYSFKEHYIEKPERIYNILCKFDYKIDSVICLDDDNKQIELFKSYSSIIRRYCDNFFIIKVDK